MLQDSDGRWRLACIFCKQKYVCLRRKNLNKVEIVLYKKKKREGTIQRIVVFLLTVTKIRFLTDRIDWVSLLSDLPRVEAG
jgi:hypothetical protein